MGMVPETPQFVKGRQLRAALLNELVALIPTVIIAGPGLEIKRAGQKITVNLRRQGNTTIPLGKEFKVVSVEEDYLICHTWDGRVEGLVDVKVALPPLLRRTPFDGQSRDGFSYVYASGDNTRRTSTNDTDSTTEEQVITPSYVAGDVIVAMKRIEGTTGVFEGANDTLPLEWVDMNVDGRCFMEEQ